MLHFFAYHPDVYFIEYTSDGPGYTVIPSAALICTCDRQELTFMFTYN
ncbi:hypothetical protein [Larkinella punicea]|nr:hypothetical protein [Larkinella punicea]